MAAQGDEGRSPAGVRCGLEPASRLRVAACAMVSTARRPPPPASGVRGQQPGVPSAAVVLSTIKGMRGRAASRRSMPPASSASACPPQPATPSPPPYHPWPRRSFFLHEPSGAGTEQRLSVLDPAALILVLNVLGIVQEPPPERESKVPEATTRRRVSVTPRAGHPAPCPGWARQVRRPAPGRPS